MHSVILAELIPSSTALSPISGTSVCVCECVCVCVRQRDRERKEGRQRLLNTKFGNTVMRPTFKCGASRLLTFPPSSDTFHLNQDHLCSRQSRAFNTVAVQNGGYYGRTCKAESVYWVSYCGRHQTEIHRRLRSLYDEDVTDVTRCVRHFKSGEKDSGDRPGRTDQPLQRRRRPKGNLMSLCGMNTYWRYVNCSPQ